MSIVDGRDLIVWEGGLFERDSDLLKRTQWAFGRIRDDGGTIILNEAGRPYGVPGDVAVGRAGLPESRTASGRSTVYYQWGRCLAGLTPSAANPALGPFASEHTQGKATDTDAPTDRDAELRRKYFGMVGMFRTIPSESWHFAIRRDPESGVSLAGLGAVTITPTTPEPEEDFSMTQGLYYRMGDDQPALGTIGPKTILYQEAPGEPLLPITFEQWRAAAVNKNAYVDLTTQEMTALVNIVGVYDTDPKTRRRLPAQAGHASHNGFSVYLP